MNNEKRIIKFGCYLGMLSIAIAVNLLPVCLTSIGRTFGGPTGLNQEHLGRIAAAIFAGVVTGLLGSGPLADRMSAKTFVVSGHVLAAIGLGLLAYSHSYIQVLEAAFLLGLGAGCLDMILGPVVCALEPEQKTAAVNWLYSVYGMGAALTTLASVLAFRAGMDWRSIASGMFWLPAVLAGVFLTLPLPRVVVERERLGLRQLIRQPFFLAAMATMFLSGATEMGMTQWLPAYAQFHLGLTRETGGMALFVFALAMAAGRILSGFLSFRISIYTLLIGNCLFTMVLFLISGVCPVHFAALIAAVTTGFAMGGLWPGVLSIAVDRYPRAGPSLFGLLGAIGNTGGGTMSWGVGRVADATSLALAMTLLAVCPFLIILLMLWMRKGLLKKSPLEIRQPDQGLCAGRLSEDVEPRPAS